MGHGPGTQAYLAWLLNVIVNRNSNGVLVLCILYNQPVRPNAIYQSIPRHILSHSIKRLLILFSTALSARRPGPHDALLCAAFPTALPAQPWHPLHQPLSRMPPMQPLLGLTSRLMQLPSASPRRRPSRLPPLLSMPSENARRLTMLLWHTPSRPTTKPRLQPRSVMLLHSAPVMPWHRLPWSARLLLSPSRRSLLVRHLEVRGA